MWLYLKYIFPKLFQYIIEHVQVSQSPERNDPLEEGDIDYEKVFQILADNGYNGDVGLEYTPSSKLSKFFV